MSKKQALAPRAAQEVALPSAQESWGMEEMVGRDNVAIPFLRILQPLSPQLNSADAAYVEGARAGDIFHTTDKVAVRAVQVIPVRYSRSFLEFVPRDAGGGFRGEHSGSDAILTFNERLDRSTGRARLDNGNDLIDTRNMYVLIVHPDGLLERALISMSSTQIKKVTHWNAALLKQRNIAEFVWDLSSVKEENKKGKWFGWAVKRLTATPPEMVTAAKDFHDQIVGGAVVVDRAADFEPEPEEGDNAF